MSDLPKNTSEIPKTPESNQAILVKQSDIVKKIVEDDPILQKNLEQITDPKEFFQKLTENAYIFEKSDNLSAQKTFQEQSLKGLEYGQYTKDGRKFEDLKPEDIKGLNDSDYDIYNEWKIARKQTTIISEDRINEGKKATIISEDRINEGKKATIIEFTKKNKTAGEEITKIQSTLSQEGKKQEEQFFQEAKQDPNNPVYRDLISKGIDPSKGEFDNILRASIILANADALRKESANQTVFNTSLRELGKLGIPYPISKDMSSISAHIDSRFPKGESTERAKGEIKKSIESGNIASIYYDGKGEKYTLIDKDGKVSKEVYMDPPRTQVMRNGLSISRDIAPNIADPARERNDTRRNIVAQIVPTIARDTREMLSGKMEDGSDITSPEIGGMLDNTLSHISLRNSQSAKLSRTMIETTGGVLRMEQGRLNTLAQDKSISNPLDPDIGSIRGTMARITAIMESLQKIQEKTTIEEENTQSNTLLWDKNARETLQLVTSLGYDELGQDNLDALIQGLRVRDGKKGIWSNPVFDMTDTFTRDQQIHSLRRFAEQSGGGEGLQNIKKQIQGNEEFRRKWRNPESWILQEQPKKTETP